MGLYSSGYGIQFTIIFYLTVYTIQVVTTFFHIKLKKTFTVVNINIKAFGDVKKLYFT